MLSWTFFLLAIRSFILAWQKPTPLWRTLNVATGTFSLALFFLLPRIFNPLLFFIIAAVIGYFLYRRISNPAVPAFSIQKLIGWGTLYTAGALIALTCSFFRLSEDQKIAKVILTGDAEPEWVSWKNPSQEQIEGSWLNSYEIVIEDLQGKEISRQRIYGDLVGLRAEVMTIEWPLQLLGLSNLAHLETVYNGYKTAARHNELPHWAAALPFSSQLLKGLWDKLFQGEWKIPGIKNASLESSYLPLVSADLKPHEGVYWLTVGNSGLMIAALED
jgi:hypothetical protein